MKWMAPIGWLYLFYLMLPFISALDAAFSTYRYVNGSFQRMPFSIENAVDGFVAGVIISVVLIGLTKGIQVAVKWVTRRHKLN